MNSGEREQLAREAFWGCHPLFMFILEYLAQTTEFTLRECIDQVLGLSDERLADFVERGIIPSPVSEPPMTRPSSTVSQVLPELEAVMLVERPALKPWQRAVEPGDAVVLEDPDSDLLIFGQVLAAPDCPADYVRGEWYSVESPWGEIGENHRSMLLMRLKADELERVDVAGWPETLENLLVLLWPVSGKGQEG